MTSDRTIEPGQILTGALFNEPMRVETVRSNGSDSWVVGLVGLQSERFRNVTLTKRDLETLIVRDATKTYDGDGRLLRLANAMSALYPRGSEEKRLLDAMFLAMPR